MNSLNSLFILLLISSFIGNTSCKKEEESSPTMPLYSEVLPDGYQLFESESQNFWLDTIASNLSQPWGMTFLPSGDILFTEKEGRLNIIDKNSGKISEISGLPAIAVVGQGGLLDLQLHPEFVKNALIYFSFSKRIGTNYTTAIGRAKLIGNSLIDYQELFEASPPYPTSHHFGCRIVLKDGFLFFGVGDRGSMEHAQMLDRHNGKVMRLNYDGSVPADNPFVNNKDAKPEIWSYGHRNPQGLTIHPITKDIWEHEHGPKGGDEINIIAKGKNYGWPVITYGIDYDGTIISSLTHKEGMEQPVTFWDPSIAPCGMVIYSGDKYPKWKNNAFIGGLAARALFRVQLEGDNYVSQEKLLPDIARVRNVAQSPDGFIYIGTESPGYIFRLVPVNR